MPKPKAQKTREGKQQPKRNGKPLNVWIDANLRDLFAESAKKNKRQLNSEVEIMIEEYLVKRGIIPPKGAD